MAYTPTTWTTGDTITASAMNKIENGIANAGGSANVIIKINMTEGEAVSIDVIKNDTAIVSKFTTDPSSVKPFVYRSDTDNPNSIHTCLSYFYYEDGALYIYAYNMYVVKTPGFVQYYVVTYDPTEETWYLD